MPNMDHTPSRRASARKCGELLQATEDWLEEIARTIRRQGSRLRGKAAVARRVGKTVGRLKVSKHFEIRCEDDDLSWNHRQDRIDREAEFDGLRVVRTSLDKDSIGADETVEAYECLAQVEQAFRRIKTGRPGIRPIFVHTRKPWCPRPRLPLHESWQVGTGESRSCQGKLVFFCPVKFRLGHRKAPSRGDLSPSAGEACAEEAPRILKRALRRHDV